MSSLQTVVELQDEALQSSEGQFAFIILSKPEGCSVSCFFVRYSNQGPAAVFKGYGEYSISDQKHMRQNLKQWSSCKCLWSHCMLRCHSFTICCVTIYQVPSSYVWCLQAACADAAAPVSHAYRAFDRDLWPMHVNSRRAGEQQEKPLKI